MILLSDADENEIVKDAPQAANVMSTSSVKFILNTAENSDAGVAL